MHICIATKQLLIIVCYWMGLIVVLLMLHKSVVVQLGLCALGGVGKSTNESSNFLSLPGLHPNDADISFGRLVRLLLALFRYRRSSSVCSCCASVALSISCCFLVSSVLLSIIFLAISWLWLLMRRTSSSFFSFRRVRSLFFPW